MVKGDSRAQTFHCSFRLQLRLSEDASFGTGHGCYPLRFASVQVEVDYLQFLLDFFAHCRQVLGGIGEEVNIVGENSDGDLVGGG